MRKLWITDEPMPASVETIDAAQAAGAAEILHGIPPALADVIEPGTLGPVEVDDVPPSSVPGVTLADVVATLRDPLANLTASSASTTVRTAILNQRAALDELLAVLETP